MAAAKQLKTKNAGLQFQFMDSFFILLFSRGKLLPLPLHFLLPHILIRFEGSGSQQYDSDPKSESFKFGVLNPAILVHFSFRHYKVKLREV